MSRRNHLEHARDLFDPHSMAQTSLFADLAPTAPIRCVVVDPDPASTFPVLAERAAAARRQAEYDAAFEQAARDNASGGLT